MQIIDKEKKEKGILHSEGERLKKINMKDEKAVLRFCRYVEKDENWALRMKKHTDDFKRLYVDPQLIVRPVNHLSYGRPMHRID